MAYCGAYSSRTCIAHQSPFQGSAAILYRMDYGIHDLPVCMLPAEQVPIEIQSVEHRGSSARRICRHYPCCLPRCAAYHRGESQNG